MLLNVLSENHSVQFLEHINKYSIQFLSLTQKNQ